MSVQTVKMIGNLEKRARAGKTLAHALETVASWNAKNPTHPRGNNGRFVEILGAIDSEERRKSVKEMSDFLHGLVREHKAENTKLGKSLLDTIGRTAEPKAPKVVGGAKKPSTPAAGHDAKALADEFHAMDVESGSGGMDAIREKLKGKTAAQLKEIAEAAGPTVGKRGTKAQMIENIAEGTLGFRQRSRAIGGGVRTREEGGVERWAGEADDLKGKARRDLTADEELSQRRAVMKERYTPEELAAIDRRESQAFAVSADKPYGESSHDEAVRHRRETMQAAKSRMSPGDAARVDALTERLKATANPGERTRIRAERQALIDGTPGAAAKPELGRGRGSMLGDRVGERGLSNMIEAPEPEDRDLFDELTKGMTLAQLKQLAQERGVGHVFPTFGNKEQRRVQLREHLIGTKLNHLAISGGSWSGEGISLTPQHVRAAHEELRRGGEWASLADVRSEVGGSRLEQDTVLMDMLKRGEITLIPEENRNVLTAADRDAALNVSGEPKHLIGFTSRIPQKKEHAVDRALRLDDERKAADRAAAIDEPDSVRGMMQRSRDLDREIGSARGMERIRLQKQKADLDAKIAAALKASSERSSGPKA